MKTSHFFLQHAAVGPGRRILHLLAACLLCIAGSLTGLAQNHTMTYETPDDLKHYTTKIVPGGSDESAMAGTIFRGATSTVHFMRLDAQGNIIFSKEYVSGYPDERAIDLQSYLDPNTGDLYWYIICQARNNAPAQDLVRILCIDDNGSIVDQEVYRERNFNMYPMHSTIWSQGAADQRLYICGYATQGATTLPAEPTYLDSKHAFVFAVNLDPAAPNHLDPIPGVSMAYDWNTGWGGSVDYDMAMRIIVIQATGELFVTGSVNGIANGGAAPDRSATMNLVVDPNMLNVVSDDPFLHFSSQDNGAGPCEYGVDLVQAGGINFVLANMASPDPVVGPIGARAFKQFYVQSLNANYTWSAGWDWYASANEHWALHAIPTGGTTATLATLIEEQYASCIPLPHTPNANNIQVNLITVDFSSVPPATFSAGPNMIYMTSTGTGSFRTLGSALSNVEFGPTFAAVGGSQYVVSAPKEMNGMLNMKYINPDLAMNEICGSTWDCNQPACMMVTTPGPPPGGGTPPPPYTSYFGNGNTMVPAQPTISNIAFSARRLLGFLPSTDVNYPIAAPTPCQDQGGNATYRQSSSVGTQHALQTKLYPNPATNSVSLQLSKDIAEDAVIRVELHNLLGQRVSLLYNGRAEANIQMTLPQLSDGVYLIHVYANDKTILNERLMISEE